MQLAETLTFYLVVGLGVGVAVYLSDARTIGLGGGRHSGKHTVGRLAFVTSTAVVFWPLYLPLLLSRPAPQPLVRTNTAEPPQDDMARAIAQVELELDAALSSLDGWAEDVLESEKDRIGELRQALSGQACRIREMDGLLLRAKAAHDGATFGEAALGDAPAAAGVETCDRWLQSERARAQNMSRLEQVRRHAHSDLLGTLAWIRELVSMIHLAKFTGAPASRAEELVAQIAAAVEGISAVEWPDESRAVLTVRQRESLVLPHA